MLGLILEWLPRLIPCECLRAQFMREALLGLLLIAPMTATMGVQVVNLRMAFFADAISHSAFAGVALGLLFAVSPVLTMPLFGLCVGLLIMAMHRRSSLPSDTVIGVVFAAVMAFGLAIVSRDQGVARDLQRFLYGDILTINDSNIFSLWLLGGIIFVFQTLGYNRMLYLAFNPVLAKAHRVQTAFFQYTFSGLLALVIMFSVWAVGVLLVTALLIVPAASARNFARSAGSMFWWAIIVSLTSAVAGLLVSAQDWARVATGPTIVLWAVLWFAVSYVYSVIRRR